MGTQAEPIIREFMNDAKYISEGYFTAKHDAVFFTLFAGVFISYSQLFAVTLAAILILSYALLLTFSIINKNIDSSSVKKILPKGLLITIGLVVIGFVYVYVISFLGKTPFVLTYT